MARPTPTTVFQEELYASLAPIADQDSANDWDLLNFCGSVAATCDLIEEIARDDPDTGRPGWAILMDPYEAPSDFLGYLAQFVGVTTLDELSDADQRARIVGEAGFVRGTPAALEAAASRYLTGAKTVVFQERSAGNAYNLTVLTYAAETPNSALVLRALLEQKPAGIILDYATISGATYLLLRTTYATYTALKAAFVTYTGVRNNVPGT